MTTNLCPDCGSAGAHSGLLHKERPDGPVLNPLVEILRCRGCRREFRADGVPYDGAAQAALWREFRRRMAHAEGPFD